MVRDCVAENRLVMPDLSDARAAKACCPSAKTMGEVSDHAPVEPTSAVPRSLVVPSTKTDTVVPAVAMPLMTGCVRLVNEDPKAEIVGAATDLTSCVANGSTVVVVSVVGATTGEDALKSSVSTRAALTFPAASQARRASR